MSRLAKAVVAAWLLSLVYRNGESDGARGQEAVDAARADALEQPTVEMPVVPDTFPTEWSA